MSFWFSSIRNYDILWQQVSIHWMEEIIFSDLWISNRKFSSYKKFTSIFLIFKIFEKIVSFFLNFHGISSIILPVRPVAHPILSESCTMTHSFRFIGLGHANSANSSLVYLLNEIEFWLLLSSLVTNGITC